MRHIKRCEITSVKTTIVIEVPYLRYIPGAGPDIRAHVQSALPGNTPPCHIEFGTSGTSVVLTFAESTSQAVSFHLVATKATEMLNAMSLEGLALLGEKSLEE